MWGRKLWRTYYFVYLFHKVYKMNEYCGRHTYLTICIFHSQSLQTNFHQNLLQEVTLLNLLGTESSWPLIPTLHTHLSITWLTLRPLGKIACIKPTNNNQCCKLIQCYLSALHEPLSQHDIKLQQHKLNIFGATNMGLSRLKCTTLGMRKMAPLIHQSVPAWTNTNSIL
jgi:hypothetical protein